MDEISCARFMQQIARALNYCHQKNIIHRDIKPENIMLGEDKQIKLIDFGLAIIHKPGFKKQLAGTLKYLAPETFSRQYDTKVDIWSLGICLLFLLTGKYAFDSKSNSYDSIINKIKN